MSFLTTTTEEMLAAEALLSGINSNLAAQNAGAASATTAIAPAAADPVSAQQAAIFSAYGTQYQAIASEAQTLLEQYSQTLGISSNSYGDTEAVNASQTAMQALSAADPTASAATGSNPIDILAWLLCFNGQSSGGLGGMFGLSSNGANIGNIGIGNWASATSNLLGLAGGGLLDTSGADAAAGADLATSTAPVETGVGGAGVGGVAGMGAMPAAAMGQATTVSKLSVPPSWAGTTPVVGSSSAPLQTVGWTAAAPQAGVGTVVPGMPGVGTMARNSAGFGAPRYGVKPIVMPKPATV
ncbi:PE domain-containing protein [Mycobacterium avium subsp. hominissuis]|uniref:PPE family protein, SVP subgroup n=1 Tax=Mycobacterium avium complex (MAC) TaxID=120793 RepID=UPI00044987CE|nr:MULTISPECIES: PE domain-containing protein [Mycobacterium avium complex (MAC)]ETZ67387.1 PE family protein [Mycobacterium sp. MAC_080597_8934]ETZ75664.1 PE family protein [Mycobacterium sp. MAC_011194_8550]QCR72160.1 PE domain-containing protein [Mycobacterium avium subsp. hominissuis]QCR75450.1 PE domain-containing protein [Mycobacterium avium subsp. hominissuis]QCR83003.1 PE domain-containing protein [Mycobacterium avium subsp. hominissuis]